MARTEERSDQVTWPTLTKVSEQGNIRDLTPKVSRPKLETKPVRESGGDKGDGKGSDERDEGG